MTLYYILPVQRGVGKYRRKQSIRYREAHNLHMNRNKGTFGLKHHRHILPTLECEFAITLLKAIQTVVGTCCGW